MNYFLLCAGVFCFFYFINISYMSVLYHRGLTHRAVLFPGWVRKFIVLSGPWITGLDPKTWCCLHRLHHLHSDKLDDPHSPTNVGVAGVFMAQKNAYSDVTWGLIRNEPKYTSIVEDLDFPLHWLSLNERFWYPYAVHAVIAIGIGLVFGGWLIAACYFFGMMSHPIQGWMVNSLGHRYGYRNFALDDNSRNNIWVSLLVMGEGYQNNHHRHPQSPQFGVRWWEIDPGFWVCRAAKLVGILRSQPTGQTHRASPDPVEQAIVERPTQKEHQAAGNGRDIPGTRFASGGDTRDERRDLGGLR